MKKFLLFALAVILLAACNNNSNNLPQLTGISLNKAKLVLEVGDTYKLNIIYEPEDAETGAPEITWESSKESVASVNANGKVTAKKQGKTTITAYCGKLYADCSVEVTAATVITDPDSGTGTGTDPEPEPEPDPTYGIENGAITKAVFQVNSAGKKVRFSQGNLQYQASTDTWRFAEYQCDVIGDDNSKISSSYSGWIDLFGYGTGNNPTNASENDDDYSEFVDWGTAIKTDNTASIWRTLTGDEWVYIYETRTNAANLRGRAMVNNVYGYIFLPDTWSLPGGMSFTADAKNWTTNTYSVTDWSKMEQNGAVFLPAAG
ncbi:MAG: Ig-like domain-containing protein [Paludibacteraceae bacterium]|nr:Ig-like domain-containing protein [Paludibacteraceae bacterium]